MIKKFFECYLPITCCNLKCEYCYVAQNGWKQGLVKRLKYSPSVMKKALSSKRLGGPCFFSICGGGETLMHPDLIPLIKVLLEEGHYVNLTNNGTYTKGVESIVGSIDCNSLQRLHFAFSLHWDELNRLHLLETFAANVEKVKDAGCSFCVQINLCDSYSRQTELILKFCNEHFGAPPQVAATRRERNDALDPTKIELYTDMSVADYKASGSAFESPLFDFTMRNFNLKQHKFCYAGNWTYCLELSEGVLKPCYCNGPATNIFENVDSPLPQNPVGHHCKHKYCVNSSHFLSLGVIPNLYEGVTYAGLRDRPIAGWYNPHMRDVLSRKLSDANVQYCFLKKVIVEVRYQVILALNWAHRFLSKVKRMIFRIN